MKLTGLTDLLAHISQLSSIRGGTMRSRIAGLLAAARPAVTAAYAREFQTPTLVVLAHPHEAQEFAEELRFWTESPVTFYPAIEALPYERVHLDRAVLAAREALVREVVNGHPQFVVAPVRALMQPVQTPDRSHAEIQVLSVGMSIQLDRLLSSWVEAGYTPVAIVDEPGTYARRGGVIDIFPAGMDHPVRVELFGSAVESLRTFDPLTQRSLGPVDAVAIQPIAPVNELARLTALDSLLDLDISSMHAEAQTRWKDDLSRLEAGASIDELAVFAPYLLTEPVSLMDCFPSRSSVVIHDSREVMTIMDELWEQAAEVLRAHEGAGDLPHGLKSALLDPDRLRETIGRYPGVEFLSGSDEGGDAYDWSGLFTPPHLYSGRVQSFASDMRKNVSERVVITSYQHERVEELLREENIPVRREVRLDDSPARGITLLPAAVGGGWSLPDQRIALLTDRELFGRPKIRSAPRKHRPARDAFFTGFAPGDYIVHMEHGIGRFDGITRMSVDGAEREYALLQYAGSDRVYVPSDQLERLTRYVGVGESKPQLNRLGGGEWQRARTRAKQAAAEIAKELIDLYARRMARPGFAFTPDTPWQGELESSFPYPETPDQLRAITDIKTDMEAPRPMDRLVCADVGYGKTEVAVRAAFKALMDGKQVAVLVPTTILAQQHYETFSERFRAFPVRVEVLSRFRTPAQQRDILARVAVGEVDVLIGTHRLLQKDVTFKNLGLLVVDEEQRFGVKHKEQLKKLRETIDTLTLTATPIPRTLHMGLVGIREISIIETPPEGRLPIKTYLQPFDDRVVREAILRELDRDGQVYIVHNKVATIEAMVERIRTLVPEARVLVGHGQMEEAQLERVMLSFAHNEADVLVCSTIIENGLDIPNVNTIIVNNAHRLGLTQLYQLRGRVGRSENQAYAYLLYPRDVHLSHDASRRLEAVFEAQELGAGFSIAMKDLEIRGAGNLLGADQSGHATAIGFDLYTRMVGEAVEALRGIAVDEPPLVSLDLPLTRFLPSDYVGNESERLTLYRRLASVTTEEDLDGLRDEIRDRFGPFPVEVENMCTLVHLKLLAASARVVAVSLTSDVLVLKGESNVLYDRVSLYRRYGSEARISTNVLRIPRMLLGDEWLVAVESILTDMGKLRASLVSRQQVGA